MSLPTDEISNQTNNSKLPKGRDLQEELVLC